MEETEARNKGTDQKEVECVAESLGNVAISTPIMTLRKLLSKLLENGQERKMRGKLRNLTRPN
jgi:hypothetical protein